MSNFVCNSDTIIGKVLIHIIDYESSISFLWTPHNWIPALIYMGIVLQMNKEMEQRQVNILVVDTKHELLIRIYVTNLLVQKYGLMDECLDGMSS